MECSKRNSVCDPHPEPREIRRLWCLQIHAVLKDRHWHTFFLPESEIRTWTDSEVVHISTRSERGASACTPKDLFHSRFSLAVLFDHTLLHWIMAISRAIEKVKARIISRVERLCWSLRLWVCSRSTHLCKDRICMWTSIRGCYHSVVLSNWLIVIWWCRQQDCINACCGQMYLMRRSSAQHICPFHPRIWRIPLEDLHIYLDVVQKFSPFLLATARKTVSMARYDVLKTWGIKTHFFKSVFKRWETLFVKLFQVALTSSLFWGSLSSRGCAPMAAELAGK